jgi:hypothetical protein
VSLVQPLAEAKTVAITVQSAATPDLTYLGDEDRVRQILVNLLNNAVKFTEDGGRIDVNFGKTNTPDFDTRLGHGTFIYVRVSDTGIGIPVERIASIFDPFVQVDTGHTRQKEGSGLGLTISRRLARLMKGDLTVQSEPGRGSTFTLWLPSADGARLPESGGRSAAESHAESVRGLGDVGEALLTDVGSVVREFVTRVRAENLGATAHSMRFCELADHIGTYIADVASILVALDESHGRPSPLLADGTEIQRLVAERHGAQRARLGWSRDDLSREWAILREETERIIKQRVRGASEDALRESLMVVRRFVEQGHELSCRALTRAQATDLGTDS